MADGRAPVPEHGSAPEHPLLAEQGPDRPRSGPLAKRVADADRDRTVAILREHVVDGRLTLDEFSERVGTALRATTRGELEAVTSDLPTLSTPAASAQVEPATRPRPSRGRRWHVAIMSGHDTKGRWRISGKTNAVAVMGGCDLDLRQAEIEGPEVTISAVCFWGGVRITVPEGFDVELRGVSFMGGRRLRLKDVPRIPGSPVIVVKGYSIMGGIEVRSRSSRSSRALAARAVSEAVLGGRRRPRRRDDVALPPGAPAGTSDGTVTILFCDMVDYAGLTERLGDRVSRELLHEHHRIVRQAVAQNGGREISVQGDGFMVAFGGAARALRCAVGIQKAFDSYTPAAGPERIGVHIGIHTGDAVSEGDDVLGHTVIVASRLADVASPGEILVSSLSEQLVAGSGEFEFTAHREITLKGLVRPQPGATLEWTT
jgi:class 3 adenylate cyclase